MTWSATKLILLIGIMSAMASRCEESNSSLDKVMDLPLAVKETSGLAIIDNNIYTHNDSGDGPYLYLIDTLSKNISKRIQLRGAKNNDWEDISSSDGTLYIGDIGNNTSSRNKYRLFKIESSTIDSSGVSTSDYEELEFTFRNDKGKKKNVNSEAMITIGDTSFFLSKELGKTEVYRLDPGSDRAQEIAKLELPFEATGWTRISENKSAVCGYRKIGESYYLSDVVILEKSSEGWENVTIEGLNLQLRGQFEGIAYSEGYLYLTAEGIGIGKAQLFRYKHP